jgi:hypothetical protein
MCEQEGETDYSHERVRMERPRNTSRNIGSGKDQAS